MIRMNTPKLGKLEEIKNLRVAWTHEARGFTTWLAQEENMTLLGEALDIEIAVEEQEAPVGGFRADIFATEVGTGRRIIIENQLEDTNHDHLGKLITYASGRNAEIIVWVVRHAREEHRSAIEWLNNHTDETPTLHRNLRLLRSQMVGSRNSDKSKSQAPPVNSTSSSGLRLGKRPRKMPSLARFSVWENRLIVEIATCI